LKFHPAAQILAWCLLVATLQVMMRGALLVTTGLILLCAYAIAGHKFIQLVRRTRWIMLSLLVIYAYSTPGQPLSDALGIFSPIREGLSDGVQQLSRLLAALAGLALLLERLHRQQLIAGLYILFGPLHWLGVSRERIAVRLALTLHYAEVAMLRETHDWRGALGSLFESYGTTEGGGLGAEGKTTDLAGVADQPGQMAGSSARKLELPLARFAVGDALLTGSALLMLWLAWR
jgi:energy-coupling factor transport system permease protein